MTLHHIPLLNNPKPQITLNQTDITNNPPLNDTIQITLSYTSNILLKQNKQGSTQITFYYHIPTKTTYALTDMYNPPKTITLNQLAPNSRQAITVKTRIKELTNDL